MSDAKDEERARAWLAKQRVGLGSQACDSLTAAFAEVREEGLTQRREEFADAVPGQVYLTSLAALRRVADAARSMAGVDEVVTSRVLNRLEDLRDALAALDAAGGGE